jgi:hypothetical protein
MVLSAISLVVMTIAYSWRDSEAALASIGPTMIYTVSASGHCILDAIVRRGGCVSRPSWQLGTTGVTLTTAVHNRAAYRFRGPTALRLIGSKPKRNAGEVALRR